MSDLAEVREHIQKYPNTKVVVSTTLVPGGIVCIGPVRTLFGPEIHCHEDSLKQVRSLIAANHSPSSRGGT